MASEEPNAKSPSVDIQGGYTEDHLPGVAWVLSPSDKGWGTGKVGTPCPTLSTPHQVLFAPRWCLRMALAQQALPTARFTAPFTQTSACRVFGLRCPLRPPCCLLLERLSTRAHWEQWIPRQGPAHVQRGQGVCSDVGYPHSLCKS